MCTNGIGLYKPQRVTDTKQETLTYRNPTVWTTKIDVALWDGCHSDMIKGPGEEGGKGTGKGNSTISSCAANGNTHLHRTHQHNVDHDYWLQMVDSSNAYLKGPKGLK